MRYLFAAALLLLAVPAEAAPLFSLVMVEDCVRLDKPHPIAGIGGLPMCVAETPFLTEKDIIAARISTEKGAAIDSFYVQELDGRKILNPLRQSEIEEQLGRALARLDHF